MPKAKITVTAQDKGVKDVLKVVSDLEAKIKSLEAQLKRYDVASKNSISTADKQAMFMERLRKIQYANATAIDATLKKELESVNAKKKIASAITDVSLKSERLNKLIYDRKTRLEASSKAWLNENNALNDAARKESNAAIATQRLITAKNNSAVSLNRVAVSQNNASASAVRLTNAQNQQTASVFRVTTAQNQANASAIRAITANTQSQIAATRLVTANNQKTASLNRVTVSQNQAAGSAARLTTAQNQAQMSAMRLAKMQNAVVQETEHSHKSWLRHIATVASGILVYQGIRMAMGGVVSAISGGIKAVSDFQDRIIGMTAMYTTFAKDQSDIAATYRLNKQYAEALVPVLQDIDRYTAMNLDQLMQVNHALAVQGIALNTNNKEQIQGYTNLSNAILFLTKGQATTRQISQEIRALMNGQIRPGIDVLSEIINKKLNGNLKEHLAEWKKTAAAQKDSGYILAKLGETLDGFTPAAKDMANTWTGVTTSFETTMNILQREIFTDILADWIEYIKQLNDYLRTHKEEIAEAVKGVWEDMKKIALAIYENWDKVKIVLELIIGYKILNGILQLALAWEKVRKSVVLATEAIVVLETVTGSGAFLSGAMTAVGALTVKVGLLTIGIAAAGWAAYEAGERLGEFIRKGSGIKLGTLGGGMSQAQANEEWKRLKAEGVLSRDGKSCKADLSSYMGSKLAPTQPAELAINQNNGDNTTSRAQSRLEEQARKYAKALDDVKLLLEQTTAKQSAYDTEATKYIETENKVNKFLRDNNKYRQFGVVITDEQADAILKAAKANEVYNQSVASGGESGRLAKLKADVSEYLKYEKAGYITHKEFVEKTYEAIRDSQKSSMGYRLAVEAGGSKGVQAELALQLQEYVRFHDSKYLTDEEYSYKRLTATTAANRKIIELDNSTMGIMKQATLEWSDSWASTLNDMVWGAETSFVKILESFGQMITQMIIMKQLVEPVVGGLSGLFTSSSSSAIDASYNANAGTLFADGGIMTSKGSLPLRTYATGGIANRPQVSVFGEGSMAEAYVPLPDGRSIPVTMNANQQPAQPQTIKVEIVNESSEQLQTKNAQVKQDTSGMILSIVIDGINRNKMGMRDLISAR